MSDVGPAGDELNQNAKDVGEGETPGTGDLADLSPDGGADAPDDGGSGGDGGDGGAGAS